jgi:hypothetical protein
MWHHTVTRSESVGAPNSADTTAATSKDISCEQLKHSERQLDSSSDVEERASGDSEASADGAATPSLCDNTPQAGETTSNRSPSQRAPPLQRRQQQQQSQQQPTAARPAPTLPPQGQPIESRQDSAASRTTTTAATPAATVPNGVLIRRHDNEISNGITSERNRAQSELDEPKAPHVTCGATANEDRAGDNDVGGKRAGRSLGERPEAARQHTASQISRPQAHAGSIVVADHHRHHHTKTAGPDQRADRDCCQRDQIDVALTAAATAAITAATTKQEQEEQQEQQEQQQALSSSELMLATSNATGTTFKNDVANEPNDEALITVAGQVHCQVDASTAQPTNKARPASLHARRPEADPSAAAAESGGPDGVQTTASTTRTTRESDEEACPAAGTESSQRHELNQISINGTTFYHVNPATLRSFPPPPTEAYSQPDHYVGLNYLGTYQPLPLAAAGGCAPNLMPYFQHQLYHHLDSSNNNNNHNNNGSNPNQNRTNQLPLPTAAICSTPPEYYCWPGGRPMASPAAAAPTATFPIDLSQQFAAQHFAQVAPFIGAPDHQRPMVTTYHCGMVASSYDQAAIVGRFPVDIGQAPSAHYASIAPAPSIMGTATPMGLQAVEHLPPPPPVPAPAAATTTTGVSQLKLGYNLIPLLPINAIPTRVRQAYGMDKVWQDEFEQLFSQFVSQVVWTLVEVETNPSIRSSSRILAYKGRYIVRVDGVSDETNGGASPVSTAAQDGDHSEADQAAAASCDDHDQADNDDDDDDDDDDDGDGDGDGDDDGDDAVRDDESWIETDDNERTGGPALDSEDSNDADSGQQGRLGGSNCESDCDSGAVLSNSTSGASETASQDSSGNPGDIGPNRSVTPPPTGPPPSQMNCANRTDDAGLQSDGGTNFATEPAAQASAGQRKFPLKFRMFIDSAKVRFCCDSCGHGWTSMKGRVVFWYELFELVDGPSRKNAEGVSNLIGYCAYKLFGQQCDVCKIENRFERPMWYPEEVTKVLCNLFNKIGQVYFGLRMPTIDKQRRAGKPKTSHNNQLCQACHDGVCTDRK